MNAGDFYIPKRLFQGILIPNWVMKAPLSAGAKIAFGVLVWHSDDDGCCDLDLLTLAEHLQVTDRQVRTYLAQLEAAGMILSVRRGLGLTNLYRFLWHPLADAAPGRAERNWTSPPDRKSSSSQGRNERSSQSRNVPSSPTLLPETMLRGTNPEHAGAPAHEGTAAASQEGPGPEREPEPDWYGVAAALLYEARNDIYTFTGEDLAGKQRELALSQIAAHLENGRVIDVALIKRAADTALEEWRAAGAGQRRGVGWVLNRLRDLLQADVPAGPARRIFSLEEQFDFESRRGRLLRALLDGHEREFAEGAAALEAWFADLPGAPVKLEAERVLDGIRTEVREMKGN